MEIVENYRQRIEHSSLNMTSQISPKCETLLVNEITYPHKVMLSPSFFLFFFKSLSCSHDMLHMYLRDDIFFFPTLFGCLRLYYLFCFSHPLSCIVIALAMSKVAYALRICTCDVFFSFSFFNLSFEDQ